MNPRMLVWTRAEAAGLVLACLMAACGSEPIPTSSDDSTASSSSSTGDENVVSLYDNSPSPTNLYVEAGKVVEWRNVGANDHSVSTYGTPDEWEDTPLKPGQSFLHVFEQPGEYAYICVFHGEIGAILVSEGSTDVGDTYPDP